jgi:GH15 family glucan-1,4-alpha-glucosidase
VWFTVADGVLSDVYFPTNDTTNNETLQYVVTDGSTFTDLQTRDMTYAYPTDGAFKPGAYDRSRASGSATSTRVEPRSGT